MVDFIKTIRWRNLKNKIKKRKKTDPEQVEIDLSLMAAIENVHDAIEMNTMALKKINDYLYSSVTPILFQMIKNPDFLNDPEIKKELQKVMAPDVYEMYYGKEESDDNLHC